jgi:hypothetical protein
MVVKRSRNLLLVRGLPVARGTGCLLSAASFLFGVWYLLLVWVLLGGRVTGLRLLSTLIFSPGL